MTEAAPLTKDELDGYMYDYNKGEVDLTSAFHARLLATISQRDETIRELNGEVDYLNSHMESKESELASLRTARGIDRERLARIMCSGFWGETCLFPLCKSNKDCDKSNHERVEKFADALLASDVFAPDFVSGN